MMRGLSFVGVSRKDSAWQALRYGPPNSQPQAPGGSSASTHARPFFVKPHGRFRGEEAQQVEGYKGIVSSVQPRTCKVAAKIR